jgi:two-component system response regulator AtoC
VSADRRAGRSILIVDDEAGIRHGLANLFKREGFIVHCSESYGQAMSALSGLSIDVAVVDVRLKKDRNGIDLLREFKKIDPDIVVIVITGYGSIDSAVTSMKEGAADYVLKPIDNIKLLDAVNKNLELRSLKSQNVYLRSELFDRHLTHRPVTENPELRSIIRQVDKIKNSPATVLLAGESGTGKEVLARYLHFTSSRGEGQFVSINCAALSESLLLSELFGHERGSFTGAIERKLGKFEIASGGSLFLDEVGDMPLEIQAKLLRVIEEHGFERVGGNRHIRVDVRIIAATNKNLPELMARGLFRDDLYYRLNVVSFEVPPLRRRREDIPLLARHFLDRYAREYNKAVSTISAGTMEALAAHSWPGNVRELENVINQAVLLCDGEAIDIDALKTGVFQQRADSFPQADITGIRSLGEAVGRISGQAEKRIVEQVLEANAYNKSKTARDLDITRKTLARKIEKYGITNPAVESPPD